MDKKKCVGMRFAAIVMAWCLCVVSTMAAPDGKVVLKAGTIVPMALTQTLKSKGAYAGQSLTFRVTNDVLADGKVVIAAGAVARGQVSRVEKAGLMGSAGQIDILVNSVETVDGKLVALDNSHTSYEGSERLGLAIVLTICCIFGFCLKGTEAVVPAGLHLQPCVVSNTPIAVD